MNSLDLIFPLVRRWKVIVAAVIVCGAAAAAVAFLQSPKYQSTVQLFVSAQGSAGAADEITSAYAGSEFTTARVQSYIELVKSPEITRRVIADLHLPLSTGELADEITATAPANTVLMNVTVKDSQALRAKQIASAVASELIALIRRLESAPGHAAPVRVSVSSPATYQASPVSPRKTLDVAVGLILGLLIGIGAAQVLDRLDETVGSERELTENFGVNVLASIPFDASASAGLESLGDPASVWRLEALRALRTSLRYIDVDNPPRCIVITSCDPGAGKSVTASSLSMVIADAGADVVVVEGDLRRPRLRGYMNASAAMSGLADVLVDGRSVEDALYPIDRPLAESAAGALSLLPSGGMVPNPSELLGSNRMRELIAGLRDSHDITVIDAPPLLPVTDAAILAALGDGVVMVVEYGRTSRHALQHALTSLDQVGARLLGVVVNKTATGDSYGYGYGYSPEAQPADGVGGEVAGSS